MYGKQLSLRVINDFFFLTFGKTEDQDLLKVVEQEGGRA